MNSKPQCSCSSAPKLIFPCSGASDVGGLSDQAARQMTLELAEFKDFQHLKLTDMGFEKGKTPVTAARVREVANKGAGLLAC